MVRIQLSFRMQHVVGKMGPRSFQTRASDRSRAEVSNRNNFPISFIVLNQFFIIKKINAGQFKVPLMPVIFLKLFCGVSSEFIMRRTLYLVCAKRFLSPDVTSDDSLLKGFLKIYARCLRVSRILCSIP